MSTPRIISFLAILLSLMSMTSGFSPVRMPSSSPSSSKILETSTTLNVFGNALKGAFSNDDSLGKRKNEGLSGGPDYNESVTVNGKQVKGAVVGQKLTVVAGRARVKIPVNCQKGDCGTLDFLALQLWFSGAVRSSNE